jgi:hypothetical protein
MLDMPRHRVALAIRQRPIVGGGEAPGLALNLPQIHVNDSRQVALNRNKLIIQPDIASVAAKEANPVRHATAMKRNEM